ncbi:MAG: T9SS type A sorting domain-containing protein [Chitinophagaceae bacterium]
MRKWLCCSGFVLLMVNAHSQIRWDGGGNSTRWMDPLNWDADRLPESGDTVILNHEYVSGNYLVELPGTDTSVSITALIIAPLFPDSIFLLLPPGNSITPALEITGAGNALVLGTAAVFINQSGAASGTPVVVSNDGWFRIENGGHYIHRTERGHTTGLVSRLSQEPGTELGLFEFDVPGAAAYTVSVSNRVYGSLRFSANAAGSNKTYTGAGINPFTVRGDLHIESGATLSYGSNVGVMLVGGNCRIDSGARFNIANGNRPSHIRLMGDLYMNGTLLQSGTAIGTVLEWVGQDMQYLYGKGNWEGNFLCRLNNDAGLMVDQDWNLPGDLALAAGILRMSEASVLSFGEEAIVTGASEGRFVDGAVRKFGGNAFAFPVGKGGIYSPLAVEGQGSANDTLLVLYQRANPHLIPGLENDWPTGIDHLSYVEYWELISNANFHPRLISLYAAPTSFVGDTASLVVMSYEATQWLNKGRRFFQIEGEAGLGISGWVGALTPLDRSAFLCFGSTAPSDVNPLPVHFIASTGQRIGNGAVRLQWEIGDDMEAESGFFVQTRNSTGWRQIWDTTFSAPARHRTYSWVGFSEQSSSRLFRIGIRQPGNPIRYSRDISVEPISGWRTPLVFPNPGTGRQWLRWEGVDSHLRLNIYNSSGVLLRSQLLTRLGNEKDYLLNTNGLGPGTYIVEIQLDDARPLRLVMIRQ